ncbi:unnamed protein product [Allacma fusca]|uniref:G-protein coupled receptors family 1 profile domain-containing protein n=1 Tax=Allacma fusca TaxID=39272 RepID=A0A8J2JG92_9HEXA|nr:unnamed protein product [Allacma fusca]
MELNFSSLDPDLELMADLPDVNQTVELEAEYIFDRYSVRVIFIALYSIVFILCVVGNLAVLLVVSLHWRMRHITKFCLANLAFADLCVGLFCVYQNLFTYLISSEKKKSDLVTDGESLSKSCQDGDRLGTGFWEESSSCLGKAKF